MLHNYVCRSYPQGTFTARLNSEHASFITEIWDLFKPQCLREYLKNVITKRAYFLKLIHLNPFHGLLCQTLAKSMLFTQWTNIEEGLWQGDSVVSNEADAGS